MLILVFYFILFFQTTFNKKVDKVERKLSGTYLEKCVTIKDDIVRVGETGSRDFPFQQLL